MQPSKLKTLGFVLLLTAVMMALVLQATGFGLVTSRVPPPPTSTTTPQGTTVTTTTTVVTVVHLKRVAPFAVLTIAGLVCLAMGYRNQLSEIE
jgi:hypothetical protein